MLLHFVFYFNKMFDQVPETPPTYGTVYDMETELPAAELPAVFDASAAIELHPDRRRLLYRRQYTEAREQTCVDLLNDVESSVSWTGWNNRSFTMLT